MVVVGFPADKNSPQPKTIHLSRRNAPKKAPCPHCGQLGTRRHILERTVRDIAYQSIVILRLVTGEYNASCSCCVTFRTQVAGVEAKAKYTNRVRDAVLDRLLDDRMSMEQIQRALQRDFQLDLSSGFLYDCLDWKIRQLDHADYRHWSLVNFSGTLCIDELHLGPHTLLLATDPLADFPVAFALVSRNDRDHMARFLGQLRDHGFQPRVVVTDGSPLYPALLAQLWPQTEHQLCVFHVIKDINQVILDELRRLRRQLQRRGNRGRRRRRGRPAKQTAKKQRRKLRDQALFIYKHRYLIVRRRDSLTAAEQTALLRMLEYLPALRHLREFVDQVYGLFATWQTPEQARRRYQRLLDQHWETTLPGLAPALKMLEPAKFEKMIAFLRSPVGQRVRTNNHVERTNRKLRLYEKIRYKWRRRRTIVRFVVLMFHRQWPLNRSRLQKSPGTRRPIGSAQIPLEASPPNRYSPQEAAA